jgi:Xaa-Pro aminopeptidase
VNRSAPGRWRRALGLVLALLAGSAAAAAEHGREWPAADGAVLPPRAQVAVVNRLLAERLNTLLPRLMAETGIDLWLVIAREYAEDPVYDSLVPQPSFAARRTTMLVFHRRADGSVERLSVNRYPLGEPYTAAWSGGDEAAQWQALAAVLAERDPARIGINVSADWAVADGLTASLRERLAASLPEPLRGRLVSAERLVVRWLETRTPGELALYPHIMGLARGVIAEAFSRRVITPGATHTDDVAWYIRERFEALGLRPWFQPSVSLQRPGGECAEDTAFCAVPGLIQPGDVLHTDVGLCYLGLCTDTQEMAYVARSGETAVPPGLQAALAAGNRWQDLLAAEFVAGRRGNEVLAATRAASRRAGLLASTYTHPLGRFGHAPGPTIGSWDNQGPTPGQGDWPLHADTVYAIEGNVKHAVPEWNGQRVQILLEQGAHFDGRRLHYPAGRQTRWHLVH